MQHLWYSIVCKDGQLVNVFKTSPAVALETRPNIGDENLSTLQEGNLFVAIGCLVSERRKVLVDKAQQLESTAICLFHNIGEGAIEFLDQQELKVMQTNCKQNITSTSI